MDGCLVWTLSNVGRIVDSVWDICLRWRHVAVREGLCETGATTRSKARKLHSSGGLDRFSEGTGAFGQRKSYLQKQDLVGRRLQKRTTIPEILAFRELAVAIERLQLANHFCDQCCPAGLMAGPDAGAVVAVEVFVKENMVAPMRIVLE